MKPIVGIFYALLFIAFAGEFAYATNRDVCASCSYTSIVQALAAAQSGDIVRVAGGTYPESVDIQRNNWQIRLEGGYDPGFLTRNSESIIEGWLRVTIYNSGRAEIDGFTVRSANVSGITVQSEDTDVLIANCKIHNNSSYGIYISASAELEITNNLIYQNGIYGGIAVWRAQTSGPASITNNTVHSHSCRSCHGIMLYHATDNDLIRNNVVYGNEMGISVTSELATSAPDISYNRVYSNSSHGISITKGAANLHHNLVYGNQGHGGVMNITGNMTVANNTFANNQIAGFSFVRGNGQPYIRNNIFQGNGYGLTLGDVTSYASSTFVVPNSFRHNSFYSNSYGNFIHLSSWPEMSFNSEAPGSWGDINKFTWADANFIQDAMFLDAANGDLGLAATSFLIDEGADEDSFALEPAPNGSRVNLGAAGNTAAAEISAAAPQILLLSARQAGNNVEISLSSNASVSHFWLDLAYWDGSDYQAIPAAQLGGENYLVGYKGGRVQSGANQIVSWQNTHALFGGTQFTSKIRATLSHGNSLQSMESSQFLIDYPLVTVNPTATAAPTITSTATASPTPLGTPLNAPSASPIPTPPATSKPSAPPEATKGSDLHPKPTLTPINVSPTKPVKTPNNKQADKKKKAKQKPKIRAFKGKYEHETGKLELPISALASESSQLTFKIQLRRQSRKVASLSASSELSQARIRLSFEGLQLERGIYTYCLTARDANGNLSEAACNRFAVTSN